VNFSFGDLEVSVELPRGITGFRHVDDPPLPVCDFAAFRGHCYAAARVLHGRVVAVEAPIRGVEANFARAVLELPTGWVAVLLNAHFPVVAFAEPQTEGDTSVRFTDVPGLAEAFRGFGGYEVPDVVELTAPLTPEQCQHLAPAEREQVKYWRPERVGELVFNFWD
jgi:hypothetical protein